LEDFRAHKEKDGLSDKAVLSERGGGEADLGKEKKAPRSNTFEGEGEGQRRGVLISHEVKHAQNDLRFREKGVALKKQREKEKGWEKGEVKGLT